MTPQLQQAIRLLQLSSIELQTEIREALEANMMLEMDEESHPEVNGGTGGADADHDASIHDAGHVLETSLSGEVFANDLAADEVQDLAAAREQENIPDGQFVDEIWWSRSHTARGNEDAHRNLENFGGHQSTLTEHLIWQLNLIPLGDTDRVIAAAIIDALDENGYLQYGLDDVCAALNDDAGRAPDDKMPEVTAAEVLAMLHLVQTLEPTGVGARDLRECLLLQLQQYDQKNPLVPPALELVSKHLQLLSSRDFKQLRKKLGLHTEQQLQSVITLIQSLEPRPCGQIHTGRIEYVAPDVYVKKINGHWKVELNQELLPRLRVNVNYASLIRRADNSNDNLSLKTHLQEAKWFIKGLQSRSATLQRIATCIVERQQAFFEHGDEAMKPMVLHDVAERLGLHASTVSRGVKGKYMHTPKGLFELKYFFSSQLHTDHGGATSSTAVRALIKKLIEAEKPKKPLSDNNISALLSEQGLVVARRTVAKYREAMDIPPSNERKRLS